MNDLHDLAPLYALDALDPGERERFEAHLATCDACQHDVASFAAVTTDFAEQVAVAPPPALRAQVLAAVSDTPQTEPDRDETPSRSAEADVVPIRRAFNQFLAVAAVVALVIGGFVIAMSIGSDPSPAEEIVAAADADDTVLDGEGTADVRIIYSASSNDAAIVAENLDDLSTELVYELWAIAGDDVIRAGEFRPNRSGALTGVVDDSRFDLRDVGAWALTVEPIGGVDVATGAVIYLGEV